MNIDVLTACDRLVTATVNGLWQGIIITVLVGLSLRLLRGTNAATRHAIWFSTLLLLVFLIPVHWWRDGIAAQANEDFAEDVEDVAGVSESVIAQSAETSLPPSEDTPVSDLTATSSFLVEQPPLPPDYELAQTKVPASSPVGTVNSIEPAHDVALSAQRSLPANEIDRHESFRNLTLAAGTDIPRLASMALLSVWALVAIAGSVRLGWRLWLLKEMKDRSSSPGSELNQSFGNLCAVLGVRRKVELRTVTTQQSPLLAGFIRPMILFPIELTRPASRPHAEQILRHELAHLQRRDDWINLIQQGLQAVLFFHPSVWWISRQLSLEREIACDDHVLQQAGRARSYALLLANLAAWTNNRPLMLAPGVSTNKSQLQQRINMILDTRRNISPRLAKAKLGFIASIAAAVAALAMYSAPRIVLAQTPAPAPAPVAVLGDVPSADNVPFFAAVEESGPRYKPEGPGELPPPAAPVAVPGTPAPPAVTPVPGLPPRRIATPRPVLAPRGPRPESSIEERLARLEEMVHELMAQRGPKPANFDFRGKRGPDEAAIMELKEMEKMKAMRDVERIKEHAKREAARAGEDAKRATKEGEKVRKLDAERRHGQRGEALGKQLETLERQRENLERQMEKLQQQIEELQQNQEELDEEQDVLNEIEQEGPEKEAAH